MGLGRVALEPVDQTRLRRAEGEPVMPDCCSAMKNWRPRSIAFSCSSSARLNLASNANSPHIGW